MLLYKKSFTQLCATFRIKEPFLCHPILICMNVGKKNPIIWIDIICASSVKGAFERWFLMNWALKDRATFELFPVVYHCGRMFKNYNVFFQQLKIISLGSSKTKYNFKSNFFISLLLIFNHERVILYLPIFFRFL